MTLRGTVLRDDDVDEAFAAHWDSMPASRGRQADIYDSWAWHAAWLQADPRLARSLRIAAVLEGDRPVALLPLTVSPSRSWRSAGLDCRPRSRVVLGAEQPDPEVVAALADTLVRSAPALALHRLPSHDPATHALIDAMRDAGYRVSARERSADRLAPVDGGWDAHRRQFKGFAQYAKRFSNRAAKLWDLTMDAYGTAPDASVAVGFRIYADLQALSWKGAFDRLTFIRRKELLLRAEKLGWARVFVLRIAGVPVAAHVWFRLGDVATWLSTAHDQSLNALAPGTIAQWWSQERIFHDPVQGPPSLVDLLPGGTPQKDRLSPVRPPLLEIDAVRTSVVAGVTLRARRDSRRIGPAIEKRVKARLRALRSEREQNRAARPERVRRLVVPPGRVAHPIGELDVTDPALRRFLAAVAGGRSPEAMIEAWSDGDSWWQLGVPPVALVRVGAPPEPTIREVIRFDLAMNVEAAAGAIATALGSPVAIEVADRTARLIGRPLVVRDPSLPWPRIWRDETGMRISEASSSMADGRTLHPQGEA